MIAVSDAREGRFEIPLPSRGPSLSLEQILVAYEILPLGLSEERLIAEEIPSFIRLVDTFTPARRSYVRAMILENLIISSDLQHSRSTRRKTYQRINPGKQDMQFSTDNTIHPHLIPVSEWFGRKGLNAALGAGVLCIAAYALLLDLAAEHLNGRGLGLGLCEVGAIGALGNLGEQGEVGDPGVVFDGGTRGIEFPVGDLMAVC